MNLEEIRIIKLIATKHFFERLAERKIQMEWVLETINKPDAKKEIKEENQIRFWKCIHSAGNKYLRVVINPAKGTIITVFFDRNFRKRGK